MRKYFALIAITCLTSSLFVGCSGEEKVSSNGVTEITIPHYKVGQNVGAKFFVPQVERFNTLHADKYKINIEELPQDGYNDKIKQLAQQNKLPALVEAGDTDWINSYIIPNKKYYDLSDFISSNEHISNVVIEESLQYNTQEDGSVSTFPRTSSRPIGLFYNSTLYTPEKPIRDMSVDEFVQSLGDNKLAFITGENAWTTMLFYTSLIANEEGGVELLNSGAKDKITDFNNDIFINATTKLQEIAMSNGSSNMLGAAYADAANSFMSKNSAIIFNGSWMGSDFEQGSEDKWSNGFDGTQVVSDIYPGNVAIDTIQAIGWWIPDGLPEDELEVALAFLEFINTPEELEAYVLQEGGVLPNLEMSEAFKEKQKERVLINQLNSSVTSETHIVPTFEYIVHNSISQEEFGKLLPKLFDGSITPEEFCATLTEKAQSIE
ncbi:hypothetical protein AN639_00945 [Candidatus Epulonipiscium fishelsonii]|uniref:Uncharacterized protein n=1 Tax=Candidatus Epulonipiscium fishelsonii TaxID=77094 RepID=A0ACC8XC79_9FIRM|nr:hypothetical protein AN396_06120 [Epulopiscium sp. SCG-B11WGA-EpuloA1]ONI41361.1 hypothetical protein AN639_00945 [Epulopiscium sp. SCG-B05WGA-EpuloA1]